MTAEMICWRHTVGKLKSLILIALLTITVGAFPGAAAAPREGRHEGSARTVVDAEVWSALTASRDRTVAVRAVTKSEQAEGLEIPLQALERTGSISSFAIAYGENAVYVQGSGRAIRFLAAWPSVVSIALTSEAGLASEAEISILGSEAILATGAFAGTVTDGTTPLANIRVRPYRQTGPTTWRLIAPVQTESDGTYVAAGLEIGIYRAEFEDPSGDYVPEYYDDQSSFAYATSFVVNDGETTTGIGAALSQAGHIAGTVTAIADGEPVADIVATAWYSTTSAWRSGGSAPTSGDGTFDIGGLPAGNYRVRFADVYSPPRYIEEVYDNVLTLEAGADVPVTAGTTTSGIDAALGTYGRIAGTITGVGGIPVEDINADIWQYNAGSSTWEWVSGGATDESGAYVANGLTTGDYRVQFSDPKGQYGTEVYDDKATLDAGDDVHVELGQETTNIDAVLDLAPDMVTQGLAQDWNLMSFPVTLDDLSTASALETVAGTYDVVWAYDACAPGPDPWLKYDPDDPLSSLTAVDTEHGYWIDMTAAADLTVTGTHPISTMISLCTGWNLIGYPSVSAKPVTEILAPIEGKYDLVYGYDGSDVDDPWKKYNPNVPVGNDLTTMRPWYGYWIKMTEPATLTIPGR
jgi:hypothetical protein